MSEFPEKILRAPAVLEITGWSQSQLYKRMALGDFPKSFPLTPSGDRRATGWLQSEVMGWIAERAASRNAIALQK